MKNTSYLRFGLAGLLAFKYAAFLSFLFVLFLSATNIQGHADSHGESCVGQNLLPDFRSNEPDAYQEMLKLADDNWFNGEAKFWRVDRDGLSDSYLYGTAHVTDPRVLDMSTQARAAFFETKTLLVEIKDLEKSAAAAFQDAQLRDKIFFTSGETLEKYLTSDEVKAIETRLATGTTPWFLAKRMQPWLVMGLVGTSACENARRLDGKAVLDVQLQEDAEGQGKVIIGLETAKEQFLALAGVEFKKQVQALKEVALQSDLLDNLTATLIDLYLEGDIGQIWPMLRTLAPQGEDDESNRTDFERRIVKERN